MIGDEMASASRRQLWFREVQMNDARFAAVKQQAERDHAIRMGELMRWMIAEEGGEHNGQGPNAGPDPPSWSGV